MKNAIIDAIEKKQMKDSAMEFNVGDQIKVFLKIVEGAKTRTQAFEGTVIAIQRAGVRTTFIVRKVVAGVGVEKTFLFHSPNLEKIEIKKRGKVRRAKLYYLRDRVGSKATRIKDAVTA